MTKRVFSLLAILFFAFIFAGVAGGYSERQTLSPLARHYLTRCHRISAERTSSPAS